MSDSIQKLRAEILAVRDCGEVCFAIEARPVSVTNLGALLDEFVAQFGFLGLGASWDEIDLKSAQEIAREILFRDLAYGIEMTTEARAADLAAEFLGHFPFAPRLFTNATFERGQLSLWTPISGATFDTGIIGLDEKNTGILWVQDED